MNQKKERPIGIFDSGVGGISVLKQLVKDYPGESFVYLGDTARLPYGTKSSETIIKYAQINLNFLLENFMIKALVVACNSVSTVIESIDSPIPLFGVIKPGAKAAIDVYIEGNSIGLWATQATVLSGAYQKEISKLKNNTTIKMVSCPTLISLVEECLDQHPLLFDAFDYYLKKFEHKIDVLILGCTHFSFFKDFLSERFPEIKIVDSLIGLSQDLRENLNLKTTQASRTNIKILLSDETQNFSEFIQKTFKTKVEKVDIQ